jgi:hypothetical protein
VNNPKPVAKELLFSVNNFYLSPVEKAKQEGRMRAERFTRNCSEHMAQNYCIQCRLLYSSFE